MKKILPSNAKTKKYLDSLPKLYLVAFWAKWGTREYPFSGKYDKDGLTPLVWDYYDFNGERDEYRLVPITHTTAGAIACWAGGSDGYGHIAIVKKVYNDGNGIETLNSAYKSTIYYTRSLKRPFNFGSYRFQGFIYCPFVEPDPEPVPPEPTYKFAIGDKVELTGDLYRSSNSEKPAGYIRDRVTEVTRLAKGTKHPYNTTGDLGWCDEDALKAYSQPSFKVGDKVEPIKNVSYTGGKVVRWDDYYYITELKGDRAVLSALRKGKYVTWCAMNTNNLRKV